ncbi:MAG: DUF2892 domain-containing protein [Saprospiraceae bacterium]|nr:DUF2892 domain-containing protein [Saprospiraceae bacterium]MBK8632031.1 DUF2892 domain-containing protein [Saprospiraceae bacterium]HMS68943.1 DUF2892 domain-containing protein [Saprospiraceae bacterium]
MKKNMGTIDKSVRTIIAIILGYLYYTGVISGTLGLVLVIVGFVFLLTSLISFCPLYSIFGINTCAVPKK